MQEEKRKRRMNADGAREILMHTAKENSLSLILSPSLDFSPVSRLS